MGRKLKGGFKTRQQKERLKKVSAGLLERRNNVDLDPSVLQLHDHCYSSLDSEQNVPSNVKSWNSGRRIVELGVLAEGLSGCKKCGLPLQLAYASDILTYGLSAIIKIPCNNIRCQHMNNVHTGKRHDKIWDANTKLATAMVHTGIGGRQVNSFLTALNIPPVSNTLLSARQKESGSAIETVAETTIAECLSQEIDITKQKFDSNELTVSVDGAWQKRGSGRSYDSLSGHCSMIGTETGKVLGFSVRSKYCKMCDEATRKGVQAKTHDCRMNWDGSAKAMEQDMVVEMVQSIKSKGSNVGTIIADDDTTTIARLRKSVDPNIKKMSDKNHVKKNIANALYQLKAKHKKLTPKVIKYLINCLNYMLCQNQDNPKGVENGLEAVGRHPFGDHSFCDKSWCSHKENASKKYSSLPFGKPLKDIPLQTDLTDLMKVYKKQSQKLSKLGSTQGNESFNKSVASKAPKSHFYSGTSSLNVRVAASVAQKNDGQCYLIKVNNNIGLSPGVHTKRLAILRDLQARKRRAISITRKEKIRRIQLRNRKVKRNAVKEMCEGTGYSCEIDLQDHQDIVEIPSAPVPPDVHCNIPNTAKVICFDLETTSLARDSHITKIAAVNGESHWTSYVIPKLPISSQASEVTGLTMRNGRMFHQGKVVESSTISTALDGFLEFVKAAERILEDHDCLVENMVMWTRDSRNRILFEERQEKFDLFRQPEKYLLVSSSSEKGASLAPNQRHKLVQEFFNGSAQVPEVEGVMYLKSEGKKAWKKFYFVLRASGLYYNPKGKVSKAPKDLTCMVQFAYVDVYYGLGWKKKYHAPTDHGFALKHPQIQKKTSKYIRYFCTENKAALDQWIMGIRMAKYGKQLQTNYEKLRTEVSTWDSRELRSSVSDPDTFDETLEFVPGSSLQDSRLSMPEPGSCHSIVHVQNSTLVRNSAGSDTTICESSDEIMCLELNSHHERKSSLTGQSMYELQRPVVKRVSFSNTHSVINSEGEEIVPLRHRDSITSSSTESSEDSISSGEMRFNSVSRASKMRARIPVTTETTRHMSEMYQQTMDGSSISSCESYGTHERKSSLTSPIHSHSFTEKDRRKSAPVIHGEGKETRHERKSSDSSREFKVRSISGDKEPLYENMHERKSSDDSREFKIHSRKASNEGVKESRHERKGSDGSRELKVRSQIIPSERGINESRHDRKGSDGSRELKVRSQAIPNDRYIQESHHERKGSNSSQDSLNRQNHCDKISGIHAQQLLTDVKRTGSPPPPNKQVQSTQNYKRPLTPPPARPIQPIEEVMPPYSSLPLSPPPNRVMSPTPSRERLCTPPPPPTHSNICNMRERLTSPPPPPIQRVMSPPTVNREMTSHSRSSSSSSHYSNLSTEDHFPVPPGECHKMSSYPQPPSTLMSTMSNKSMAASHHMTSPAAHHMTSPAMSNKAMPQTLPQALKSPPMLSHHQPPQLVMSPPASKHFSQNALPLSHPIASQMSPPVSSDFATPPSPAPPAMVHTAASIQSSYSMQNDSSPPTPRSCVPMPPAMPLLQNRYVSMEIGGISPLRKSGPETVVHAHAPQMSPPIVNHQPGAYNMPTQKQRPSPLSCSTQAYNSQNSQNVISPTMYSPEGQHFNAMTTSGPQFNGPYDQMYQCGQQRVMSSSMPTSNSSMIPQSGKSSAIYDSYGNSHQPQNHMSVQSSVSSSDDHLPQQLPFLSELSQRPQKGGGKVPPATLPKPDSGPKNIQKYNGANSYELGVTSPNGPSPLRPNSNIGNKSRPPPPQRSENTRLSSEIKTTSADIHSVPNYDPLYENLGECEGLIDINDLPLPPPELLEGIGGGVPKKGKVPPPPPKRSLETHLTSQ